MAGLAEYWEEERDRVDELSEAARRLHILVGTECEPPELNDDGSLADDGSAS